MKRNVVRDWWLVVRGQETRYSDLLILDLGLTTFEFPVSNFEFRLSSFDLLARPAVHLVVN
jgi:hypothetical protein